MCQNQFFTTPTRKPFFSYADDTIELIMNKNTYTADRIASVNAGTNTQEVPKPRNSNPTITEGNFL